MGSASSKEEIGDKSKVPKIYAAMNAVMAEIGPIAKNRQNEMQRYQFRGIDDIYNAIQAPLVKHKVFSVPELLEDKREERQTSKGGILIYTILKIKYTFYAEDGSSVSAIVQGEAMDSSDKSTNKAMSAAQKYLFLQIFNIPTEDDKDTEAETPDPLPKQTGPGKISEGQRTRLYTIATKHGWSTDQCKKLLARYGFQSSNDVTTFAYDNICTVLSTKTFEESFPGQK